MQDNKTFIFESPDGGKTITKRPFGSDIDKRELVEAKKQFSWPLMKDCITEQDKEAMIDFLKNNSRLTNGPKVKKFEQEWSEWLGVKHSLFVSSGSTANLLLVAAVKEKFNLKDGDKVVVPSITWVTNVSPVFQLGLTPIFCDINKEDFSFDKEHLLQLSKEHSDIKAVFVTHLFGIAADIDAYKEILPNAIFMEDVCESHGTVYKNKKCGTMSVGSTFSSYFGHHLTTVEGGFVCTNDTELFNLMKMKRSHGMAREAMPEKFEEYKQTYPDIHPMFMFVTDGYNLRSMEINAVLGSSQLSNLDNSIEKRRINFEKYIAILDKNSNLFYNDIKQEGNSSFCLPFVCKSKKIKEELEKYLQSYNVETRPLCSGNLLRQPFILRLENIPPASNYVNAEFLHEHGFFIGNNHMITNEEFIVLESLIDEFNS